MARGRAGVVRNTEIIIPCYNQEHKLYGHGYELFCVAASGDSQLVASACKSSDAASARVILWDTQTWTEVWWWCVLSERVII